MNATLKSVIGNKHLGFYLPYKGKVWRGESGELICFEHLAKESLAN